MSGDGYTLKSGVLRFSIIVRFRSVLFRPSKGWRHTFLQLLRLKTLSWTCLWPLSKKTSFAQEYSSSPGASWTQWLGNVEFLWFFPCASNWKKQRQRSPLWWHYYSTFLCTWPCFPDISKICSSEHHNISPACKSHCLFSMGAEDWSIMEYKDIDIW